MKILLINDTYTFNLPREISLSYKCTLIKKIDKDVLFQVRR
jgi:hypothetical protein